MQSYSSVQNFGLFLLRMIIASIFFVAAYNKIPFWSGSHPGMSEADLVITKILSIVEPLGALALVIGFLAHIASFGLIVIMIGAIYYCQFKYGIGFVTPTSAGWNFPLMVLGGCVVIMSFGAGAWSIDAARNRR